MVILPIWTIVGLIMVRNARRNARGHATGDPFEDELERHQETYTTFSEFRSDSPGSSNGFLDSSFYDER